MPLHLLLDERLMDPFESTIDDLADPAWGTKPGSVTARDTAHLYRAKTESSHASPTTRGCKHRELENHGTEHHHR